MDLSEKELFDDIVEDDIGVWSQICLDCAKKYSLSGEIKWNESPAKGIICGIKGCENEAEYYYDFA